VGVSPGLVVRITTPGVGFIETGMAGFVEIGVMRFVKIGVVGVIAVDFSILFQTSFGPTPHILFFPLSTFSLQITQDIMKQQ
jgi:hypothetical protein